jgi:arabinogalactan oligomer / maltooligosaccharide transport system permease protein
VKTDNTAVIRNAIGIVIIIAILIAAVSVGIQLAAIVARQPVSFNLVRVADGWLYALGGLFAIALIMLGTSFVGKNIGERGGKRKLNLFSIFGDQLTHLAIWLVILFSLYPLFYVVAASFDPANKLFSITLPESDNIFVHSKVFPSFDGADFSNYSALFAGLTIYPLQWAFALLFIGGLFWLLVMTLQVQLVHGGFPTPSIRNQRTWASRVAIAGVTLFFVSLVPAQFTGTTTESKFLLWMRNTFLVSSITGLLAVGLTTTCGYAMARLRFPGRFETLMFFIFVQMFPGFLGLIAVFNLIYNLGLINTFPGLILAYSGGAIAFGTWIYKGYVESLPASLEEAALVDGCTRWTAFTKIVLPLSGPMLVFIFLLQFIGTYADYLLASILLTGVDQWTIGIGLRSFSTQFNTKWGIFAAASVLGSLPIVGLFYSFQQVFVSGNLSGGVKE